MFLNLPKDPVMLLSVINTKLRDRYPSLDALCDDLGADRAEIAERLGITCGAVSQVVERLVQKGPLIRVPDPDDRRSVRITLSREGLERHERLNTSFETLLQEMLQGVPPEKVKIFEEVLDHLIAAKEKISY